MPYNLTSPNNIVEACALENLAIWFECESMQAATGAERDLLAAVARNLDDFVRWPREALLLWPGCHRVPEPGAKQRYFSYPAALKNLAKERGVKLDTRPNGPAIAAFLLGGGERPKRFGSMNAWSIHHLYSGKFPYVERESTTHAVKERNHFTQSAGLIAVHPVADALADEFPFFAWFLRAHAYQRFGYDPDRVFGTNVDEFGFASERKPRTGKNCEDRIPN